MWVLEDTHGALQCGIERIEFDNFDDVIWYIDRDEELLERIENGYAMIIEEC